MDPWQKNSAKHLEKRTPKFTRSEMFYGHPWKVSVKHCMKSLKVFGNFTNKTKNREAVYSVHSNGKTGYHRIWYWMCIIFFYSKVFFNHTFPRFTIQTENALLNATILDPILSVYIIMWIEKMKTFWISILKTHLVSVSFLILKKNYSGSFFF